MNKNISKEILDQHFRYFTFSLFEFPEKYQHLIFKKDVVIPRHVAYLCPLCAKNFIVLLEQGLIPSTDFSLDHFPPKSVGGTLKILTCKKCNNIAGSEYEAELVIKMNYEASRNNYPDATIKTFFKAEGTPGSYTSFVKKNKDGEIILDFSEKLKEEAPFLKDWLENKSNSDSWKVNLTIPRPDDKKVLKAILKSAYLICFINWGYDFIFSSNGQLIREVLNNNEEYPLNFVSLWLDETNLPKDVEMPLGLCIIEKPKELQTFAVNIPLDLNGYKSIATVFIPYPGESGWEMLKEINRFQAKDPTIQISFTSVGTSLLNNIFNGYSKNWNDFLLKLNCEPNVQVSDTTEA